MDCGASQSRRLTHAQLGQKQETFPPINIKYLGRCTYEVAPVLSIADGNSLETGKQAAQGRGDDQGAAQTPATADIYVASIPTRAPNQQQQQQEEKLRDQGGPEQDQDQEGSSC